MKMSNKRLEEIIKEEIKLFTQENKLEEEDYPEMDTTPGSEYEKASARRQAKAWSREKLSLLSRPERKQQR